MKRILSQKIRSLSSSSFSSSLALAFSLVLLLTSCGVESILRQADQSYELGEYNEAAMLYKKA